MRFLSTAVAGVMLVEPELIRDARGFFARLSCPEEMRAAGIAFQPLQTSLSRNDAMHTLRGLHFCLEPEAKLVRCVAGRIFDVALDLRAGSPTYLKHTAVELDARSACGLFIPPGVAHGFLTLEPQCDVLYQIDRIFRPGYDAGVRWNDPAFAIAWPAEPEVVSDRDNGYPDWTGPTGRPHS